MKVWTFIPLFWQITCEFVSVTRWKVAICGEYMKSRLKVNNNGCFLQNLFYTQYISHLQLLPHFYRNLCIPAYLKSLMHSPAWPQIVWITLQRNQIIYYWCPPPGTDSPICNYLFARILQFFFKFDLLY